MTIPVRGSLVWLDFDSQAGQEQAGRCPAIVLSEMEFNQRTGFAVVCPITSKAKGYPFEDSLPNGLLFTGVVLTDQFKSLDIRSRKLKVTGSVSVESDFLASVLRNVRSILA